MDTAKYIDRLSQLITEDIDIINELNLGFSPSKAHDSKAWRDAGTVKGVLSKIHADSKVLAGIKTAAGPAYLAAPKNFKSLDGQLNTMKTNTITVKDHTIVGKLAETGSEAAKKLGILIGQLHLADQKLQWGKAALVVGNLPKPFMQWIQHLAKIGVIVYGPSTIVNPKQTTGEWPGQEQIPEPEKQPQKYKDISKSLAGAQKEFDPKASAIFDEMKKKGAINVNKFKAAHITPATKLLADVGRFLTAPVKSAGSHASADTDTLIASVHKAIKTIANLQAAASLTSSKQIGEDDKLDYTMGLWDIFMKMQKAQYIGTINKLIDTIHMYRMGKSSQKETADTIMQHTEIILSHLNKLLDSLKQFTRAGISKLQPMREQTANLATAEQRLPIDRLRLWLKTGLNSSDIFSIFNIHPKIAAQLAKKYKAQLQS